MSDLTTLQLAEKIAVAVLEAAYDSGKGFMWEHAHEHASAVLRTLHENESWFCRAPQDENGDGIDLDQIRPYEPIQRDLFA